MNVGQHDQSDGQKKRTVRQMRTQLRVCFILPQVCAQPLISRLAVSFHSRGCVQAMPHQLLLARKRLNFGYFQMAWI